MDDFRVEINIRRNAREHRRVGSPARAHADGAAVEFDQARGPVGANGNLIGRPIHGEKRPHPGDRGTRCGAGRTRQIEIGGQKSQSDGLGIGRHDAQILDAASRFTGLDGAQPRTAQACGERLRVGKERTAPGTAQNAQHATRLCDRRKGQRRRDEAPAR